ncbi:MAG: MerR family transcriptional regulator [Deltaproteobacteria bacterium]|nr:MerR family transcriptional regulator [Deltaproteobacteria bacterium]
MTEEQTWSISQLAKEFGVTTRSIRFYEEKGLITPRRTEGEYRLFGKRERTRLKLILRGKRFGLTLDEISDILGLGSTDMDEIDKVRKALTSFERILDDLVERKREIEAMERDLLQYMGGMRTRLAQLEARGEKDETAEDQKY